MKNMSKPIQIWLLCAAMLPAATNGAQPVTKIAAGGFHSLFLKGDGSLWAMGDNEYGQLGDGTINKKNVPKQIVASNVTAVAAGQLGDADPAGGIHSLFLKGDGSLWAMGDNEYGQLGDGTTDSMIVPEQIVASNITAIAAGGWHSLFLKSDGSLWAVGIDFYGQLGDSMFRTNVPYGISQPEQIVASNVTAIAAGGYHSLFLKSDGSLWAMGADIFGQLGDGTFRTTAPNGTSQPVQIVASNVTAIAAGGFHSLFLKSDGSLWAMGDNESGQLGDGTTNNMNVPKQIVASNVTAIAAGGWHSLFLKSDGSLWAMGVDFYGQLGDGMFRTNVPYGTSQPERIAASNVTAIAAGGYHSLFLESDGSLWAMGADIFGQLGDGTFRTTAPNGISQPERIVAGPPGYNRISVQLLSGGDVRLSYEGMAGANYALDRTFSLSPANWVPMATNTAGTDGVLVLTNTPNKLTNNFWRIRSMP
jgi:alpha-tubulin suppressor-like RCC1 family protein